MLDNKPIELIVDLPEEQIQLNTDSIKLKQVLINLVSNSIKFTHTGSITIKARFLNSGAEPQIIISVIDTGVGMNKKVLHYIFEAFRQVDGSLTRQAGGTGLGLAIVNSFIDLLRGTVIVKSEEGMGTTFEINLPVNLNNTKTTIKTLLPQADKYSADKHTILCIDDESEVLDLISDYLIDEGYQVITTTTPEEALALAIKIQPLAITLDIMMPHKDGWSVISELKSNKKTNNIPVIIVSFLDNRTLGYQLGAFDYMQKPIESERLIASIQRLSQDNIHHALVVDDAAEARDLMCQILEDENIQCQTAVDGKDALSYLKHAKNRLPEIILLDLMMPSMDGFELLHHIQKIPEWAAIPVIIVTAKTLEEHEHDFLRPRVASILTKEGLTSDQVLKQLSAVMHRLKKI